MTRIIRDEISQIDRSFHVPNSAIEKPALGNTFTTVNGNLSPPPSSHGSIVSFTSPGSNVHQPIDLTLMTMDAHDAAPRNEEDTKIESARLTTELPPIESSVKAGKRKRIMTEEPTANVGDVNPAERPQTSGSRMSESSVQQQPANQGAAWTTSPQPGLSETASGYPQDQEPRDGPWYGDRPQHRSSLSMDEAKFEERLRDEVSSMGQRQYQSATPSMHGGTPASMMPPNIETTAAGVQVDPRKRKRNFSNRTKTGCQTCRKRKKKCDEEKPECNNCKRGGFVCEGYTSKTTWGKTHPQNRPIPINLQPKDFNGDAGGLAPRPPQSSFPEGFQSGPSPDFSRGASNSYDLSSRMPVTAEFHATGPFSDPSRQQQPYDDKLQHVTSRGQPIQQYVDSTFPHEKLVEELKERNSELTATIFANRFTPNGNAGPRNPVQTAQLAEHALQSGPSPYKPGQVMITPNGHPLTEKEKMVCGQSYWAHSPGIIAEREACKAAVWRFNQALNPSMGVSREERARKFRQIVIPEPNEIRRPLQGGGRCGQNVEVEAPFNCAYGYNINISDNVLIETDCFIEDAAVVHIGRECVIGPNVRIYTNTVETDISTRVGRDTRYKAKTVTIGDNVYIGGGVVIRPGIRIGEGSKILPGTVVDKEVPRHVVWGSKSTGDTLSGVWSR